ncbi:MAG: hypothetical protein AB7S81_05445 [Bdellovibrionales bacterium]
MENKHGGITGARKRPVHKPPKNPPDTTFMAEQIEYAATQIQKKQRTHLINCISQAWARKQNQKPTL